MTKLKRRFTWLASAGLILTLLLVASISIPTVQANGGPPGLPHRFYGNVTINGSQAATGTTVAAWVGGTLNASTTVDSSGKYGYTPIFNTTGTDGQAVTFYVGGSLAPQTYTFQTGGITQLNLAVSTTSLNVTTNAATGVSSMIATLNGNLTDMGGFSSVSVSFQYGTTPSYGSTTSTQTMTTGGLFSANISGLTPSTTYYFRAVATGGSTTVYGSTLTFNTTTPALSVSTTAASSVLITSATLNGNLNDLGANSSVSVSFQYGPSIYYGYTTAAQSKLSTGNFNASLSSLIAGTTYHYRAVAQGATTVYGEDMTFTTNIGSLAVQTNAATAIGSSSATLNGTLTSLGTASSGSVYFQYGTTTSYGSVTSSQLRTSGGAFSSSITGLSASTLYHFRAVVQAGSSTVYGSDTSFTTLGGGGGTSPPHQFYGTVYVSGSPAGSGSTVAAYVNGSPAASTTTDSFSGYGYTTLFMVPGTSSGTVTFTVNGTPVPQTATWMSGGITQLNLYSTQSTLTVTCSAAYATTTSATLSGTVASFGPGDTSAAVSFEWGTSPSSLATVTATPSTVTSAGQMFTATRTGLTAGQTYYYKAKAVGNASGTVYCPTSGTNQYTHNPSTLTITCPQNTGTSGVAYSSSIQVSGGTSPYTCSIISGSLPPGLTPTNCTISGTPTTGGTYPFTIQVTDSALPANTGTQPCSIAIDSPSPTGKLVGADDGSVVANFGTPTGFLVLNKYTAVATGSATSIRVRCIYNGKVKLAIYSDFGGQPDSRLGYTNAYTVSGAPVFATVPLVSSVLINSGTDYWIAFIAEQGVVGYTDLGTGIRRYERGVSYSDSYVFPNPASPYMMLDTYGHRTGAWE